MLLWVCNRIYLRKAYAPTLSRHEIRSREFNIFQGERAREIINIIWSFTVYFSNSEVNQAIYKSQICPSIKSEILIFFFKILYPGIPIMSWANIISWAKLNLMQSLTKGFSPMQSLNHQICFLPHCFPFLVLPATESLWSQMTAHFFCYTLPRELPC